MSDTAGATRQPEELRMRTSAQIGDVDETWEIGELDCGDELREAIEAVRENHEEKRIIDTEGIWMLLVHWNENTDSVWVGTFGYNGGFEAVDQEGDPCE